MLHLKDQSASGSFNLPVKVTFLKHLDGELERPPIMKFRLCYEGELRATNGDPRNGQAEPLAEHKHKIRREFHSQLKQLWSINSFLKNYRCRLKGPENKPIYYASGAFVGSLPTEDIPFADYVASQHQEHGYKFVPLVRSEFSLLCSLDILLLRRDIPGTALQAGDIDNRVKTLIDALRKPANAAELRGNETPLAGEDPFYCLLEDDKLVSHFAVETDTLLDPPSSDEADRHRARAVITVELRPYFPTFFNLAFS